MIKARQKRVRKVNEIKIKAREQMRTTKGTKNELKSSISGTYRLKTEERRRTNEERRRTAENLREITHRNVSEALRKRLG